MNRNGFRAFTVPSAAVFESWDIIILLAGSLLGAWYDAGWATKLKSQTLYRVLAVLLVGTAAALLFGHEATSTGTPVFKPTPGCP